MDEEERKSLAQGVYDTFMECLYKKAELPSDKSVPVDAVLVHGVMLNVGFHPGRIAENKEKIRGFLNEMADPFHRANGGGYTFLNMCMDRHDNQWGEHRTIDQLICLGLAVGMVSFPMPREFWESLPGGMPYVTVDTEVQ